MFLRKTLVTLVVALVALMSPAYGAKPNYAKGTIVEIQQKTRDKVDMYLVNTPVTTAVPYFQISLELGDMNYVAEYTPRHAGEELPEMWKTGEAVQARLEKHRLFLQRPDGTDMEWIVTKRTSVHKEQSH